MNPPNLLRMYACNLAYAQELTADIPEPDATTVPAPGLENHPVFVIGHLCTGSALIARELGDEHTLPELWIELFQRRGPADARLPEMETEWPSLKDVVAELSTQHQRVEARIQSTNEEGWARPVDWRLKEYLPTLADLTCFMCATHESIHLGQLACWRRAMGLGSAMARL